MTEFKGHQKENKSPAVTEFAHLKTSAINLKKLHQMKEWRYILKAMRFYNDMAFAPFVSSRISTSYYPHVKPVHDGVLWTLLRWRLSMAGEIFGRDDNNPSLIEYLRKREKSKNQELWIAIRSSAELENKWTLIAEYLDEGAKESFIKRVISVRDRLTAHYDNGPINKAFEKLLELQEPDSKAGVPIGLHVHGETGIVRHILADEVLNIALFDVFGVSVAKDGAVPEEVEKFGNEVGEFLSLVANFINELIIHYVQYYRLVEVDFERPEWLDD